MVKMQIGGNFGVVHGQDDFDQPGNARGFFQMA